MTNTAVRADSDLTATGAAPPESIPLCRGVPAGRGDVGTGIPEMLCSGAGAEKITLHRWVSGPLVTAKAMELFFRGTARWQSLDCKSGLPISSLFILVF